MGFGGFNRGSIFETGLQKKYSIMGQEADANDLKAQASMVSANAAMIAANKPSPDTDIIYPPLFSKKGTAYVKDKRGNGSPTKDTVPAVLAEGEAVLNAGAAEIIGRDQIEMANKHGARMLGIDAVRPSMVNNKVRAAVGASADQIDELIRNAKPMWKEAAQAPQIDKPTQNINMGVGAKERVKIDSMIRKGVMPTSAGYPTMDASTGMAKGVKKAVEKVPEVGKLKQLGGAATIAAVPSMVMAGMQAVNRGIPDAAVSHPLEFIGTGLGEAYARHAPEFMGGMSADAVRQADKDGVSAFKGTRFDVNAAPVANGANLVPEVAAANVPQQNNTQVPMPQVKQPVPPQVAPSGPVINPATAEQQDALRRMGITQDRVINHGSGVDYKTAEAIEKQGKYGGKNGMFTQLSGYGDQTSMYGRASKPGGRIDEFYGVGSGKPNSPGSIAGLGIVPAFTGPSSESRAAVSAALKAAGDRGDWDAVAKYYASQGQGFGGKTADQINGVISERQFRANMEAERLRMEKESAMMNADEKRASIRDKLAAAEAAVALATERNPRITKAEQEAVRRGVIDPFKQKDAGYKVEYGDVSSAFSTPVLDESGNPVIDPITGRQHLNRDPNKEKQFFRWMQKNGITDTNKGLAMYLGQGDAPLVKNATAADITATAKKYGISEAEVRKRLGM